MSHANCPRLKNIYYKASRLSVSDKMDGIPVTGLDELEEHMTTLAEAPDTPVNTKLFDDVELQLTGKCFRLFTITKQKCGYLADGISISQV
jgi:hypothetical protein